MRRHLLAAAASVLALAGTAQPAAAQAPGAGGSQSAKQSAGTIQVGGGNGNAALAAPVTANAPIAVGSETGDTSAQQGGGGTQTGSAGQGGSGSQSSDRSAGTIQVGGGNGNAAVSAPVTANTPVAVGSETGDTSAQQDGGGAQTGSGGNGNGGPQQADESAGTIQVGGGNANPAVNAPVTVNAPVAVGSVSAGSQAENGPATGNGPGAGEGGGEQSAEESLGTVQVGGGNANPAVNVPVDAALPVTVGGDTADDGGAGPGMGGPDDGAAEGPDPAPVPEAPAAETPGDGGLGNGAAPSPDGEGGTEPGPTPAPTAPESSGPVGDTGGSTAYGGSRLTIGTSGDAHLAAWTRSPSTGPRTGNAKLAAVRAPASGTLANSGRGLWAVAILALLLLAAAGVLRHLTERRAA